MREFLEVFPNDIPRIPLVQEIYFGIDLLPETNPISIPIYRMTPVKLKELKSQLKYLLDEALFRLVSLHRVLQFCS